MGESQRSRSAARPNFRHGESAGTLPQQQQKKTHADWFRENANLAKLAFNLHRDAQQGFFSSTKSDLQHDATALLELERTDAEARRSEMAEVRRRLEAQKTAMSKIQTELRRVDTDGGEFPEGLDRIMEGLEDELYEFKCTMRKGYDQLAVMEKALSSEVEELRLKAKEWEKMPRDDAPGVQSTFLRNKISNAAARRFSRGEEDETADDGDGVGIDERRTNCDDDDDDDEEEGQQEDKKNQQQQPQQPQQRCRGGSASGERDGGDRGQRRRESYGDAVERINRLIQHEGGATGGWPQHEHDCFLRLWTQVRNRGPKNGARPPPSSPADRAAVSSLLQRAQTMLPARSSEDVSEHLAWHQRHQDLSEEKRRLAKAWREERQHEQRLNAETVECPNGTCGGITSNGNGNGHSRVQTAGENHRPAAAAAAAAAAAQERERDQKKKEVDAWRAGKEAKEREQREREELRRADEAARIDEERRRQRRQREQVAAYRLDREREDNRRREVERMLAREQKRMMFSQAELAERVKRDVDQARARRQEATLRELHKREAQQRIMSAASERWAGVEVDRDRLLRATKAWKERMLEPEDLDDMEDQRASLPAHRSPIAISGRDLRFNKGRAVPAWRRGCL